MAVKLPTGLKQKKKYKLDMQMRRMNWVQVGGGVEGFHGKPKLTVR